MRREALVENERAEIKQLAYYHGSVFKELRFFNSDRNILLDDDYTVSERNTPSTLKMMPAGSPVAGYAIELEVNAPYSQTVLANLFGMITDKLFPDDLYRMEQDCTVTGEFPSQVMSKSFIRNNYKNFKTMWNEYFPAFDISTNNSSCGMHVNLSLNLLGKDRETQIENARKLGYLINKHYSFFKIAFYRNGSNRWCPKMNDTKEFWKNTPINHFPIGHSECCFNMGHVNVGRLEIRLVGGQKNFACFRNTMEMVFYIVEKIKKCGWNDLDDLGKFFSGCNSYVFDRIATNCLQSDVISRETVEAIRPTVKAAQYI